MHARPLVQSEDLTGALALGARDGETSCPIQSSDAAPLTMCASSMSTALDVHASVHVVHIFHQHTKREDKTILAWGARVAKVTDPTQSRDAAMLTMLASSKSMAQGGCIHVHYAHTLHHHARAGHGCDLSVGCPHSLRCSATYHMCLHHIHDPQWTHIYGAHTFLTRTRGEHNCGLGTGCYRTEATLPTQSWGVTAYQTMPPTNPHQMLGVLLFTSLMRGNL